MSMPKHVWLEALMISSEYGRLDQIKPHKRNFVVMDRMVYIRRRLDQIEQAYTFDSDQEEQMV